MPRHPSWLLPVLLLLALASPASADAHPTPTARAGDPSAGPKRDYIVTFRDLPDVDAKVSGFAHSLQVRASHTYRHAFKGFAASLTQKQYERLAGDPSVDSIVEDGAIHVDGQVVPTGVARVGATSTDLTAIDGVDTRVDADIAIVDTGIQPNHPDLNVVGGYNCWYENTRAWGDVYGHGTHVAGTAAALDNGIGVVGVAPGARLWSVKVFDNAGNGKISWYACGIDWIVGQRDPNDPSRPLIEVANMSLRTIGRNDNNCGLTNDDLLHRAICKAVKGGTTVVVAAGNDHGNAANWVPASYPEVITVSALADFNGAPGGGAASTCSSWGSADRDDTFADFSNYGAVVDIMASGKCIYSTYVGSSYKVMSGTSMATPAVSGAAALWKSLHPTATPATVKSVLQAAGRYDWSWGTDPDPYHERMLNVSSFGHGGDFRIGFSSGAAPVGPKGGTAKFTVELTRDDAFADRVDLTVGSVPPGARASFASPSLSGLGGLRTTFSVVMPAGLAQGTYFATLNGTSQGLARSARVGIYVDRTLPAATAPTVQLGGGVVSLTSVPVVSTWSGSDNIGVAAYDLEKSMDGGAFTRVGTYAASSPRAAPMLANGHAYRLRVRARDRVGNIGLWAYSAPFRLIRIEQVSRASRYTGSWTTTRTRWASGGSYINSIQTGASVTYRFTARGVSWIAAAGPTLGTGRVSINGLYARSVSLYSAIGTYRKIAFARTWTTSAERTLTIAVTGTPGHPRVAIDAFVILR